MELDGTSFYIRLDALLQARHIAIEGKSRAHCDSRKEMNPSDVGYTEWKLAWCFAPLSAEPLVRAEAASNKTFRNRLTGPGAWSMGFSPRCLPWQSAVFLAI